MNAVRKKRLKLFSKSASEARKTKGKERKRKIARERIAAGTITKNFDKAVLKALRI